MNNCPIETNLNINTHYIYVDTKNIFPCIYSTINFSIQFAKIFFCWESSHYSTINRSSERERKNVTRKNGLKSQNYLLSLKHPTSLSIIQSLMEWNEWRRCLTSLPCSLKDHGMVVHWNKAREADAVRFRGRLLLVVALSK